MTNEDRVKRHISLAISRAVVDGYFSCQAGDRLQAAKKHEQFRADSLYALLEPYIKPDADIDIDELSEGTE